MSIATQASVLAKRRAGNWVSNFGKPFTQGALKWFWSWMSQFAGNPDLQILEFAALGAQNLIAAFACTLYAIVFAKATATLTYVKASDSATTAATDGSGGLMIPIKGAATEAVLFYPQGFAYANGIALIGNTTATGSTSSAANGAAGFLIIGS